jgi:hypothetical protein
MNHAQPSTDMRSRLRELAQYFEHILPAQASIRDFVHHNTLHGYQHLPFSEALETARRLTGAEAYLPEDLFREYYRVGRIQREDLEAVLATLDGMELEEALLETPQRTLLRKEVLLISLISPFKRLSRSQLKWQVEEMKSLERFQNDVDAETRSRFLDASAMEDPDKALGQLWEACLETLGLEHELRHPEELLDPSPEHVEALAARITMETGQADNTPLSTRLIRKDAVLLLESLLDRVGKDWTLRGLLLSLTGEDLLEEMRPLLVRHLSSHLDQGLAPWHNPERSQGFYAAWRASAAGDLNWPLRDLPEWTLFSERLPTDPVDAIIQELRLYGLEESRWESYLEHLALELPGWAGMTLWRQTHPNYAGQTAPVDILDFLAVRLALERLYAQRLCRRHWRIEASLSGLRWHFRHLPAELVVRHALYEGRLPEYLVSFAEELTREAPNRKENIQDEGWQTMAQLLWTWQQTPAADRRAGASVSGSAWPLFRLSQHLALSAADIRALGRAGAEQLLSVLTLLDTSQRGHLWLQAYERHYREQIFSALAANHGRGAWDKRDDTPQAQLVFCMDDREEGMRRHLEEINPRLETLGAAAHFSVFINWLGLDDDEITVLCPVVARPSHEEREVPRPGNEKLFAAHRRRHLLHQKLKEHLHQGSRRGILSAAVLTAAAAPAAAFALLGKVVAPGMVGRASSALARAFEKTVPTTIEFVAPADSPRASPDAPRLGFTDIEQADRVQAFLRNIGLTYGFAPLVAIVGHGSNSQNNPHLSAYDCGACSGRHSGPNARTFADMANRAEVRAILAERGLSITDETWFLGCEHNTCDDSITWYDLEDLPPRLEQAIAELDADLAAASRAHAQERCRRLASAPLGISKEGALRHVIGRRHDFSQARPELGHATNACAFIGRRSLSRGAFFDRRAFLISYDPTQDPEGQVLEGLLLANGPVGAGISLEYYFSTVNNEHYGCGTKVVHNVAGLLGVMEGTSSDLRTGLPRQMIEIHEAMRLLVVVEQTIDIVTAIYQRQPPLQELIGKGWLIVAAKDPDSPAIQLFDPARGWLPWQGGGTTLPKVGCSADWFAGKREPLTPALLVKASQEAAP